MFGSKKVRIEDRAFGALRSASPAVAPRVEFQARGRETKVDLRRFCSPVEDQGKLGSCNACAIVGALEFLIIKSGKPKVDLSPLFVYFNGRHLSGTENRDAGLLCHHATASIMAYGACEEKLWPYKVDKFAVMPPRPCYEEARKFDAVQYGRLGSSEAAKVSLSEGVPVVFGFDIPRGYYDAAETTGLMPDLGAFDNQPQAGHAMLIVGYDDTEKTWLARNSWGEDYGDKGYCRIPYGLADKYVWNDELWAIGALESMDRARLVGPTVEEAVRDVQARGAEQANDALRKLGEEIGADIKSRVETARTSIRDRLRAQEDELARKRDRGNDQDNR